MQRATVYWVLLVVLGSGALLLRGLDGSSSSSLHSLAEAVATALALVVGALALVRFYSRKQATFLLIGTGFLGAGILDVNHTLITSDWLLRLRVEGDPESLFAWSWTSERIFLSLFLFFSLLAWRGEEREDGADAVHEGSVYATALVLTLANLFFFEWVPLRSAHFPALPVARPAELLPGLFFTLAFAGYFRRGRWRRDLFEHSLMVSLLIGAVAHAFYMSQSAGRFDAVFDAAHFLKVVSYAVVLTGLLCSVFDTFRREAETLGALTGANAALAREVEVRARTEQEANESRERLQDFLDNANDLIQSVDRDGRIRYVNTAWKRVLGYGDEHLERTRLLELVHPAHREAIEGEFRRVLDGEPPRRFTVEYVAADGRIVILSGSAQAQRVGGRSIATQSIFRDVTEQRIAERQLADSRANLQALVENTGDAIWSVDREHRLITFNSAFALATEARSGVEPAVGKLPGDVFPEEEAEWYRDVYARALSGDRHVALRTDEVGGELRYFELYANPIEGERGITGAVLFGKDVTPRVRAEEALRMAKEEAEAANKAKSDFLASMSHELRTPLNSVIGFTNILLKNKDGHLSDKDVGFLERVLSNGKHLLELINDVLDLAKVEAGRMELVIEEVDLAHLVRETVMQLEGQAKVKEGEVALVAEAPEGLDPVDIDPAKLKQVIINLVGNALKFTHDGSVTVRIDVAADGRTPTAVAVRDTGIGIPEDRLEAIFEAFQQAEAGTSRKYGGTGLGLAISRSICLLMGYDLIVESEVGKGSTFAIVMGERARRAARDAKRTDPAAAETPASAPGEPVVVAGRHGGAEEEPPSDDGKVAAVATGVASQGADGPVPAGEAVVEGAGTDASASAHVPARPDARSRERRKADGAREDREGSRAPPATPRMRDFLVLVIDDEEDSRDLMAHYLEDFGCRVLTAADGAEGLELARTHGPDLVTLDLMMPGMTGWDVLRELKSDAETRHIPVVVVSIVAAEGRGRLLGAVDLVTKPFDREDLLRVLWRNLVRKRGGRVLVVDDDPGARRMLADYLAGLGLEVVTADDGQTALDVVRSEAPDAVILDIMMPVMDGMTFLERLRANPVHTGLPVIVLSAKALSDAETETLRDMASGVLNKDEVRSGRLKEMLESIFTLQSAG